jgi:hypothetical protein
MSKLFESILREYKTTFAKKDQWKGADLFEVAEYKKGKDLDSGMYFAEFYDGAEEHPESLEWYYIPAEHTSKSGSTSGGFVEDSHSSRVTVTGMIKVDPKTGRPLPSSKQVSRSGRPLKYIDVDKDADILVARESTDYPDRNKKIVYGPYGSHESAQARRDARAEKERKAAEDAAESAWEKEQGTLYSPWGGDPDWMTKDLKSAILKWTDYHGPQITQEELDEAIEEAGVNPKLVKLYIRQKSGAFSEAYSNS